MNMSIKYVVTDIDGVLTDGKVLIDELGNERKTICYRDLDAISIGRKANLDFAMITGESTNLASFIVKRFNVSEAILGAKNKGNSMIELLKRLGVSKDEICYIGDSDRDIPAIRMAGIGICPQDATRKAKDAADYITLSAGGQGVLWEVVEKLINKDLIA